MRIERVVSSRAVVLGVVLAGCSLASPLAAQEPEEIAAYQAWYAANAAKDTAKAYGLAREYVQKYPSGQNAEFLKKWLAGARGAQFNAAIQAKDVAAMLKLGKERLAEDPDDLAYLVALAWNLRRDQLFASPPDYTHAAEARAFSQHAIALIEKGKQPSGVDPAKWKKNDTLAWLHQSLGVIAAKQERRDEALAHFDKSSQLDPNNASLNAYNQFFSGSLHKDRYDAAVARYRGLKEKEAGGEESAEAKAAIEEANQRADATVLCWARYLALVGPAGGDMRTKVEKTASELYAYRHPDEPGGLSKLVAELKSAARPQPLK